MPSLASLAEAEALARRLETAGDREGVAPTAALPDAVPYDALAQPTRRPGSRDTLRAAVGAVAGGPLVLDLATLGPHAIVAGTTGSGKSEFLLAWIAALADGHPPDRVSFLLVDFKGGAAFEPVRGLPHVTGIVTDLDEGEAERAVLSLRAELRHREGVLRAERVRDISELAPHVDLPRLVLVIDEFQAMIERFPELGAVVADVAARGRSLGVHLVLASQRPNGVVREQVTANCAIRVSLRVMQAADSIAVVGSDEAASIAPETPGRGVVDAGDGRPVLFQSARVDTSSIDRLLRRSAGLRAARRPWVGPLPDRIAPRRPRPRRPIIARRGGLARDRARRRARAPAPRARGVESRCRRSPARRRGSRQRTQLRSGRRRPRGGAPQPARSSASTDRRARNGTPLVRRGRRDAASATGPSWSPSTTSTPASATGPTTIGSRRRAWSRRCSARGGRRGVAVVATAASAHRLGSAIRELFGSTVVLRHPSRSDLVQAGGVGALWRADDPPGRGQWRGRRIQIVDPHSAAATDAATGWRCGIETARDAAGRPVVDGAGTWAIVTASPRTDAAALRSLGHEPIVLDALADATVRAAISARTAPATGPRVVIGDADAWMANWALAGAMREDATVIVHGGPREYRVLVRDATLPPLLDDPVAQCWVLAPRRCAAQIAMAAPREQLKTSSQGAIAY